MTTTTTTSLLPRAVAALALLGLGSCGPKATAVPQPAPATAATEPAPSEPSEPQQEAPEAAEDPAALAQAAYDLARPVLEKHCARCHSSAGDHKTKKSAMKHFSMDSYPFEGHHAGEIAHEIKEVLGAEGGKATMPMDDKGAVKGEELELVLNWANAFEKTQPEGAEHGHDEKGEHSDADKH